MRINTQQQRLATALPKRMRTLPRDGRGFPIPFIVMVDRTGTPQFTINDHDRVAACISKKLCAICGKRFEAGAWFVGGPKAFLHELGAFLDPPADLECAEYALRVCPYLAAPSYGRRIDDKKLSPAAVPRGMVIVEDENMQDARPPLFMFGRADRYGAEVQNSLHFLFLISEWGQIEFWRQGVRLDHVPDAATIKQLLMRSEG